jgi:uncharacterized damage-inducible protein DinB
MSQVQRILDQLQRAHEGGAWHGPSLRELLDGVTAAQAAAHPVDGAHSIWELVNHIAVWEDGARRRLEGENFQIALGNAQDWPPVPRPRDASEQAWKAAQAHLHQVHLRLRESVARLNDARLDELSASKRYTIYGEIHGAMQHTIYHAGQIALLKKAL